MARFSDLYDAWNALCAFLFHHGEPAETEAALTECAKRFPMEGGAHHNLGSFYHREGRINEALGCFTKSLKVRPDSKLTKAMNAQCELAIQTKDGDKAKS